MADFDALDVLRGATAFGFFQANLASDGVALRLDAQAVMGNFFDVVGVSAARGRMLAASPAAASERSVVISYGLWLRLFGGRDDAIGRAVKINGRDFTVVGVARRGFRGVDVMERADLWIPLTLASEVNPDNDSPLTRSSWWLTGVGRLAPGVAIDQAAAVGANVPPRSPGTSRTPTMASPWLSPRCEASTLATVTR